MIRNKLLPWQIAQVRKTWVTTATLSILWWESYWKAWAEVMFPTGGEK